MLVTVKSRVVVLLSLLATLAVGLSLAESGLARAPVHSAPVLAAHNDTSTPFNLVSLPALISHRFDGRRLRLRVTSHHPRFTDYDIRYRSASLTISGTMLVPAGSGPFPVVLVAHGYHTPPDYLRHTGVVREDELLARHGYVVVQPDYRNYGQSTVEGDRFVARPRGYPEDLVNAVLAVRRAHLDFVKPGPVSLLGRSMGGGVALQALVARPRLFSSAVLYSPVSSSAADQYRRWVLGDRDLHRRVVRAYGTPRSHPRFWHRASARRYLSRVTVPVQIHHGLADTTCPVRWSEATARALRRDGKRVHLYEYPGQHHKIRGPSWNLLMRRALRFFAAHRPA